MKKMMVLSMAAFLGLCFTANAQEKTYPKQEPMRPGMSEYWTPQPKIVTPGDAKTNSAPSDKAENGVIVVNKERGAGDIATKEKFGNFQLHIEWCVPKDIEGTSQSRGNSGVFLQGMYEVQILDSYENETYVNGMAGSIYKQTPPLVNVMRKPGEWNVYDIIYTAPIFNPDGTYLYRPRVTVIQNGVVLQNNVEILGTTEYIGFPKVTPHGDGPIVLQMHGDPSKPISFRNIWIRKL